MEKDTNVRRKSTGSICSRGTTPRHCGPAVRFALAQPLFQLTHGMGWRQACSHGAADRDAAKSARPHLVNVRGADAADGESGQADLGAHCPQQFQARKLGELLVTDGKTGPTPM